MALFSPIAIRCWCQVREERIRWSVQEQKEERKKLDEVSIQDRELYLFSLI